jgi:hypothetical protein
MGGSGLSRRGSSSPQCVYTLFKLIMAPKGVQNLLPLVSIHSDRDGWEVYEQHDHGDFVDAAEHWHDASSAYANAELHDKPYYRDYELFRMSELRHCP